MHVESIERSQSKIKKLLHVKVCTMPYNFRTQNPSTTYTYALGTLGIPSKLFCISSLFFSYCAIAPLLPEAHFAILAAFPNTHMVGFAFRRLCSLPTFE